VSHHCLMVSQKVTLMLSQKVVTPVKTGVQPFRNFLKTLDSGFRRNGEMPLFFLFCECIIIACV